MPTSRLFSFFTKERLVNYSIAFGAEFLIMFTGIVLFKIIGVKFGAIGFSEYTLGKRLLGFLIPFLMIGLGVSLPKFLAIEKPQQQLEIIYTALIIVAFFSCVSLLAFVSFSSFFSQIVFGDIHHKKLFGMLLIYIFVLMLHACIYNYFRGKFNFKMSGVLQLLNLGILPLLVYFAANSMLSYFFILSGLIFFVLLIVTIFYIPKIKLTTTLIIKCSKKLMSYGVQRMPGDVVLGLFFAIPTFIISNYYSLIIAGNIAFCLSLFNIIIAVMSPINIILLPEASRIVSEKKIELLKTISYKLLALSLIVGVTALLFVYLFGEHLLLLFNINDVAQNNTFLFIIFSSVVGYSVFSIIRSIIDAYYATARVSVIIISAFILFLFIILILKFLHLLSITSILIAFSLTINLLGALTYLSLINIYKQKE